MPTLAEYASFVTDMEKGKVPTNLKDSLDPIEDLIEAVCVEPWKTAGERDAAQVLIYRLILQD